MLTRVYPSPSVYWNHDVRKKLRNKLLESIACGQNPENKMVPSWLFEWPHRLLSAMIGGTGCGRQGRMSQLGILCVPLL
jgi:hypothetical protein